MKINKKIINILKNFCVINQSINISEVEYLKTISESGNIIAVYDLETPFPSKFALWNLNEFLSIIGLFNSDDTDFDFKEKHVLIKSKQNKVKYVFTEPELIKGYNSLKEASVYKNFNKFDANFKLSSDQIKNIVKSSNILSLSTLNVKIKDGKGKLILLDDEYEISNEFEIELLDCNGSGEVSVNVQNIEIISDDYNVFFMNGKMLKFVSENNPLFYFITAEV